MWEFQLEAASLSKDSLKAELPQHLFFERHLDAIDRFELEDR